MSTLASLHRPFRFFFFGGGALQTRHNLCKFFLPTKHQDMWCSLFLLCPILQTLCPLQWLSPHSQEQDSVVHSALHRFLCSRIVDVQVCHLLAVLPSEIVHAILFVEVFLAPCGSKKKTPKAFVVRKRLELHGNGHWSSASRIYCDIWLKF